MSTDIKDVLYSIINGMGRERIRMDVAADIRTSELRCKDILAKCVSSVSQEMDDTTIVRLCEALLHFMLTASLLPSERKVTVHGVDLDIVIPSVRVLNKSPDKSLIIQMIRNDLTRKLSQTMSVQPNNENIWLISAKQLKTDHRNYHLGMGDFPFPRIISDISRFLSEKQDRGLKLLH